MDKLKSIIKSYEAWVAANPETVCDVESTTKLVSYFIAGRISESNVFSELIYSLSNMLMLYNDRIIDQTCGIRAEEAKIVAIHPAHIKRQNFVYRLKVILTSLEYCEVFIEISAKRVFGTKCRWLFITFMQLVKAAGRFFLLKYATEQIITSPVMPSLNRRLLIKQQKAAAAGGAVPTASTGIQRNTTFEENGYTFQLKRSGRVVRKVEGAPPLHFRDFKSLCDAENGKRSIVPMALLQAEYLYIAKPLIHLATMGVFGEKRWNQYVVALLMDLMSIRLYQKNRHLMTKEQRLEMSHRCMNLFLYLMRSPFYESFTQSRLDRVLNFVAQNIPIVKMIARPLRDYIPQWQNTYYYMWST